SSSDGAGISFSGTTSSLTVSNTLIASNITTGNGGGFEHAGAGTATFDQVLFTQNSSTGSEGRGAVDVSGLLGTTNLKNATLTANLADNDGAGVRSGALTATTN